MLLCKKSQAKKNMVLWFMAPTHPKPPPPPHTPYSPPLKPPKMGFWQQVVPEKTTKKHKKNLKLKFFFLDQPVNSFGDGRLAHACRGLVPPPPPSPRNFR